MEGRGQNQYVSSTVQRQFVISTEEPQALSCNYALKLSEKCSLFSYHFSLREKIRDYAWFPIRVD